MKSLTETGRIDFENVSFSYEGTSGEPVLKNINLSMSAW